MATKQINILKWHADVKDVISRKYIEDEEKK